MYKNRCDWCNMMVLISVDKLDVTFQVDGDNKLWCGHCREGSLAYFSEFSTEQLIINVEASVEAVEKFLDLPDEIHHRLKRIWLENEIVRAKQEIIYRVMEQT